MITPGRHFKIYVGSDRKVKRFEPPIDLRTLEEKIKNIEKDLEKLLVNLNRQFLHAKTLGFFHPRKKKEMIFSSILPQELEIILKKLRNTNK